MGRPAWKPGLPATNRRPTTTWQEVGGEQVSDLPHVLKLSLCTEEYFSPLRLTNGTTPYVGPLPAHHQMATAARAGQDQSLHLARNRVNGAFNRAPRPPSVGPWQGAGGNEAQAKKKKKKSRHLWGEWGAGTDSGVIANNSKNKHPPQWKIKSKKIPKFRKYDQPGTKRMLSSMTQAFFNRTVTTPWNLPPASHPPVQTRPGQNSEPSQDVLG